MPLGVPVAINSDAHHPGGLASLSYGLATARRGWATAPDVLNCLTLDEIRAWRRARIAAS